MTKESEPKRPPEGDELVKAYETLRSAVLASKMPMQWQHERLGDIGGLRVMSAEYMREKAKEDYLLKEGRALHKDHPDINPWKGKPRRKGGFIDAMHSIEFQMSERINALLGEVLRSEMQPDERNHVVKALRGVAEALDDRGVFLNQLRGYAGVTTLPRAYDDEKKANVPQPYPRNRIAPAMDEIERGRQNPRELFFQRLNRERDNEKKR